MFHPDYYKPTPPERRCGKCRLHSKHLSKEAGKLWCVAKAKHVQGKDDAAKCDSYKDWLVVNGKIEHKPAIEEDS